MAQLYQSTNFPVSIGCFAKRIVSFFSYHFCHCVSKFCSVLVFFLKLKMHASINSSAFWTVLMLLSYNISSYFLFSTGIHL